ncbi:MAG TPA: histidine--tRNA ligase [Patescibacteria group bacterium]|nr:histidine--tRNA ligase [Patescibacteria group bacterium]
MKKMTTTKKKEVKKNSFVQRTGKEKIEKAKAGKEAATTETRSKRGFNVVRGMRDVLPKEERYWKALYHNAEKLAEHFQFGRIDTPIVEDANLFVRSIGKGTDVVDKEMYVFEDRDGSKVCLRPEATASVTRAYINGGMWNMQQPVKFWYWGPMFRHDRPQAGRYREFNQVGFETFGSDEPALDAEIILVAYNFYKDLGLSTQIHINSIGTPEERQRYKTELVNYYRTKRSYLCEDCRLRISKNPLRLLDCKAEQCQPVKEDAPQIIDWLGEESKSHFMKVLEYLDELGVPYVLQSTLVRGLDYYTHTVFEVYPDVGEEGAQSALGGGGRYDLLAEEMGGRPTPAVGFSGGVERSVAYLKDSDEKGLVKVPKLESDVFLAQLGDEARRRSLQLLNDLRESGIRISYNFSKNSLKTQLEVANSLALPYVLIIGQKEVQDGTVIIRDMESGVQETVDQKKVENILKKKLGRV